MSIGQARQALEELEREAKEASDALLEAETEAGLKLLERREKDQALQQTRLQIKQAREDLDTQEKLEASRQQSEKVRSDAVHMAEGFAKKACTFEWWHDILDHQWLGVMFGAVAKRWVLGDGMGLGKTYQSIAWLDLIDSKKIIVVAPAEVCDQWAGEAMERAPHRAIYNLYKKSPERRHELMDEVLGRAEGLIVLNYEIWRRDKDLLAKLMMWRADTVVVDEAHNIKSTKSAAFKNVRALIMMDNICPKCRGMIKGLVEPQESKVARAVLRPCPACGWKRGDPTPTRYANRLDERLKSKSVKNVLFTTGTPILNSPEDIFPLLHLCDPILFDTSTSFLKTYCSKNYHSDKWEFRAGAIQKLKPLIEGRFLARTYEDAGVQIPPQHVRIIPVDLNKQDYPLQYRTVQQISKFSQIVLDSGEKMTIMHLMAMITRKRQANVWPGGIQIKDTDPDSPRYGDVLFSVGSEVQESAKIDAVMSQASLHVDKRQVVFSQFKTALAELEQRFTAAGYRVARLDGDTKPAIRKRIKSNFDRSQSEAPEWDILLCNYKTAGVGLNLTAVTVTHILDEEWSPGRRDQAYGRSARIGQTEDSEVFVYRCPKTIDTWMSNIIKRKERLLEEFDGVTASDNIDYGASLKDAMETGEIL